jgi:hypothetical protein
MIDLAAGGEMVDDARVRASVARLATAQALTGANSAVIFATGSTVGATLAPDMSLSTVPLSMHVLSCLRRTGRRSATRSRPRMIFWFSGRWRSDCFHAVSCSPITVVGGEHGGLPAGRPRPSCSH